MAPHRWETHLLAGGSPRDCPSMPSTWVGMCMCACVQARHQHMCMCMCTCVHAHVRMCACVHVCMRAHMCMCACAYVHGGVSASWRHLAHTCAYVHIHMGTCVWHMCICAWRCERLCLGVHHPCFAQKVVNLQHKSHNAYVHTCMGYMLRPEGRQPAAQVTQCTPHCEGTDGMDGCIYACR